MCDIRYQMVSTIRRGMLIAALGDLLSRFQFSLFDVAFVRNMRIVATLKLKASLRTAPPCWWIKSLLWVIKSAFVAEKAVRKKSLFMKIPTILLSFALL